VGAENTVRGGDLVGAEKSSGHAEQTFRATSSDRSRCRASAPSSLSPDETSELLKPRILRNGSIPGPPIGRSREVLERPSNRTIRDDRAVPEIHHAMTDARPKTQVTGPDEFSAPTRSRRRHLGHAGERRRPAPPTGAASQYRAADLRSTAPVVPLWDGPQRVRDDRGETGSISLQRQSSCPSRPRHYVFAKPDPPSRQLGDGLWKVLMTAHDRVDPLSS
jgi:hypothetical protein